MGASEQKFRMSTKCGGTFELSQKEILRAQGVAKQLGRPFLDEAELRSAINGTLQVPVQAGQSAMRV